MGKLIGCSTGCGAKIDLECTGKYRRIQKRVYCHKCCEKDRGGNAMRFKGADSFFPTFKNGARFDTLCHLQWIKKELVAAFREKRLPFFKKPRKSEET